ncbi:MAG: class I SAM-dependent methyltransferase [Sulfuriferula sp.]|nr:class I SAM-dependent methyltransferase [Sulfuriferula sp.]
MTTTLPIATRIEAAVAHIPGWSPIDQLLTLFTLAYASADLPGDILELGSWCGRSAVALGMAAQITGHTKIHCVDLFPEKNDWYRNADGTYSFAVNINGRMVGAYGEQTVWAEPYERDIAPVYQRYAGILEAFNATIAANGLTAQVTPVKGDLTSFAASVAPGFSLRMAFIDGDHSYEAVSKDIAIVERFLVPGGWICFDDAFSTYAGVDQAITEYVIDSGRYHLCQQLTRKLFVARFSG